MASGKRGGTEALIGAVIAVVLAVVWFLSGGSSPGHQADNNAGGSHSAAHAGRSGVVPLSQLPPQARRTVQHIRAGGPFPYPQDGVVFENREGHLPAEPRGYYHEYTVVTPGSADRGPRRIVAGQQGELYYTGDHYRSFRRIEGTR